MPGGPGANSPIQPVMQITQYSFQICILTQLPCIKYKHKDKGMMFRHVWKRQIIMYFWKIRIFLILLSIDKNTEDISPILHFFFLFWGGALVLHFCPFLF